MLIGVNTHDSFRALTLIGDLFFFLHSELLSRGGVAEGRGGVDQESILLASTTPLRKTRWLRVFLLGRAAFPSSAEEGTTVEDLPLIRYHLALIWQECQQQS